MISDASCDTEDCENKLKGHHRNELHLKNAIHLFYIVTIFHKLLFFYQIN